MSLIKKIFTGAIILGSLISCKDYNYEKSKKTTIKDLEKAPITRNYFGEVSMHRESGMALSEGDFDGDRDLDLIVGAKRAGGVARLYFFENDGEGNFKLRTYSK